MDTNSKFSRPLPPRYTRPGLASLQIVSLQQISSFARAQRWRETMLNAFGVDGISLHLAKAALAIDKEDTTLQKSVKYRGSIGDKERELTASILHLMHSLVKQALIKGDFASLDTLTHLLPPQLKEILPPNAAGHHIKDGDSDKRPVLYMHFHVDDKGRPPTANEYNKVAEVLGHYRDYCADIAAGRKPDLSHLKQVQEIDEAVRAPSKDGVTRGAYRFDPKQPRYGSSAQFLVGLQQWVTYWKALYRHIPSNRRNEPVPHAVSEAGWTVTPNQRRFHHYEHGANGNKLMNVIDAATRAVLSSDKYEMRWIIVLEILAADQAAPAERILSRLASSYSTCGGTNQIMAGASVESAYTLPVDTYIGQWKPYGDAFHKSVVREKTLLGKRLAEAKELQDIRDAWERLNDVTKDGKEIIKKSGEIEEERQKWGLELQNETRAWIELARRETRAIQMQKECADLADKLNAIW